MRDEYDDFIFKLSFLFFENQLIFSFIFSLFLVYFTNYFCKKIITSARKRTTVTKIKNVTYCSL